jgi:SAM-dependent methyltransferase
MNSERYFKTRKMTTLVDYETAYWGTIVDPDGKKRDRLNEQDQYLNDINEELNFFKKCVPGKILDVGCGPGFFLSGLSDEWEKYGVEISKLASNHAEKYGRIFTGELSQANYEDSFFDAIMMYHVIEHLENPISIIKEVRRILKPGGKFVIATPDFDSACARRFGENYRLLHDKTHVSLFTNESMHRFLRDFRFEINHVDYPFFNTRHFTKENLMRLFDVTKISPPFYGNFMTFYCTHNFESSFPT